MQDKKLFIFFGMAGSGKTTFANEFAERVGVPLCDGDDFNNNPLTAAEKDLLTSAEKDKMSMNMYSNIVLVVEDHFRRHDIVCLTDTLKKHKWQKIFIDKFGSSTNFVYVEPNEKKHLNHQLERELKDPQNTARDENELRRVLKSCYIDRSKREFEYPEVYVTLRNDFDSESLDKAMSYLKGLV